MGARTPDAYRIGAGQVAQDYPADAVPARLRKQPSLPPRLRWFGARPPLCLVRRQILVPRRTLSR